MKTVTTLERRHPENAKLREKIKHIQDVSRQLQSLVEQVHLQTVAWAREGRTTDLPDAELADCLSESFAHQRMALAQLQEGIKGAAVRALASTSQPLISDEELAALMK